jgi:hypothetical protein
VQLFVCNQDEARATAASSGAARDQLRAFVAATRPPTASSASSASSPAKGLLSVAAALEARFVVVPGVVEAELLRDAPGCLYLRPLPATIFNR